MTRKLIVPALVLALSAFGAFLLVATAPSVQNKEPERAITAVRVRDPKPQRVPMWVQSQGTVEPRTESTLVPEVSGRVVWVSPSLVSGGFFEEGEPLLRIERRSYEMAIARAEASVARARGEVVFAAAELERQQGLAAQNVASPAQLSEALRSDEVARANLTDAEVALQQAKWDLERTTMVAPYRGRVRDEAVDVGQVVSLGVSLATLYATDYAEIRLPVADHQLAYLDLPDHPDVPEERLPAVILRARFAGKDNLWRGVVVRTEGEIDPKSRMVHVVARVEDPYAINGENQDRAPLAVGLFVKAEIQGPAAEDVIVVPRYAMRDANHILVIDPDDRLRIREVEILRIDGEEVLIRGSLGEGERLCVSPLQIVVEGMKVQTVADDADDSEARS